MYRLSSFNSWQPLEFFLISQRGGVRIFDKHKLTYVGPDMLSYRNALIWLAEQQRDTIEFIGAHEVA